MSGSALRTVFLIITCAALCSPAVAAKRVAVTPKVSTLGVGADVSLKLRQRVSLRLMGQRYDFEADGDYDGVNYDADLKLQSFGAAVDFYPASNAFRLTAGLLANGNELDTVGRLDPLENYEIGNGVFTGAALGDIDGSVSFAPAAPIVGLGWGNPFGKSGRLSFSGDLGVVYQPIDDAQLRSTNPLADPLIDQEMRNEEQRFKEDVEQLELYPLISIGLSIRF